MSKFACLVCALVMGSILVGCANVQPQRLYNDDHHVVYKDGR